MFFPFQFIPRISTLISHIPTFIPRTPLWFPSFLPWFLSFPPWFPAFQLWFPAFSPWFPAFPPSFPAFPSFSLFCSPILHSDFILFPDSPFRLLQIALRFLGAFYCLKVKVLKMLKILIDCHIKTCRSPKWTAILKISSTVF